MQTHCGKKNKKEKKRKAKKELKNFEFPEVFFFVFVFLIVFCQSDVVYLPFKTVFTIQNGKKNI